MKIRQVFIEETLMSLPPPGANLPGVPSTGASTSPEHAATPASLKPHGQNPEAKDKLSPVVVPEPPRMSGSQQAKSPLTKPPASPAIVAGEPENSQPSWVETMLVDVRLRVLNEVASQPAPEAGRSKARSTSSSPQVSRSGYNLSLLTALRAAAQTLGVPACAG
jgi:hypothetical protein